MDKISIRAYRQVLIVGLGNVLRRDDGVGVYIASRLKENQCLRVLNAEVSIENYIGKINSIDPDILILIDSVFFNRHPGYCRLISADRLADFTTNTHNISLKRIPEFVHAQTFILGIQPGEITFGEGLTLPVKTRADQLVKKINTCFSCE